jgi:hypothetical protein
MINFAQACSGQCSAHRQDRLFCLFGCSGATRHAFRACPASLAFLALLHSEPDQTDQTDTHFLAGLICITAPESSVCASTLSPMPMTAGMWVWRVELSVTSWPSGCRII